MSGGVPSGIDAGGRSRDRPVIAVSLGDPGGIGPEVVVRALSDRDRRRAARYLIMGSSGVLDAAAELLSVEAFWWRASYDADRLPAGADVHDVLVLDDGAEIACGFGAGRGCGEATSAGGSASFAWVERAIASVKRAEGHPLRADAIVTAPISKHAWGLAGRGRWPGHTELLASRLGAKASRMLFVAPELRVALVTGHIGLMDIRNHLTIGRVYETIDLGASALRELGVASPRVGVCGLNPHAGEAGRFGDEERRVIEPAILHAQRGGIDARGPYPGDTIFNMAVGGKLDLVVAMYHDQGLIPVKLLAFDRAVNCTIGLPTVRTSPDHGTAYDIAWRGVANAGSMCAAIDLAIEMAVARRRSLAPGGGVGDGGKGRS